MLNMSNKIPIKFTQDVADRICAYISEGKSLRKIEKIQGMPTMSGVIKWLSNDEDQSFVVQYARARQNQADSMVDEMLDIADEVKEDPDSIAKAKLKLDTRKWVSSKLKPKKYGDRIHNEILIDNSIKEMTDEEIKNRIAELSEKPKPEPYKG